VTASLAAQSQPSFKAAVDSVRLDARVVTDDGTFVRGLSKDDFRVFDDGREQSITAFSMVELAQHTVDAHGLPAGPAGPVKPVAVGHQQQVSERRTRAPQCTALHPQATGAARVALDLWKCPAT